jgi:hypothetical protein
MLWAVALILAVGCLGARERLNRRALLGAIAIGLCLSSFQGCAEARAVSVDAPRIDQVWLGFAVDVDGRVTPGCTAGTFALGDPIHLTMLVSDAPDGAVARLAVRDVVTDRIAWSENQPVPAGESRVTFAIGRKLGQGRYRAESSLSGGGMRPRDFIVHGRRATTL